MTRFMPSQSYEDNADALPVTRVQCAASRSDAPRPLRLSGEAGHAPVQLTIQLGSTFAVLDPVGDPIPLSQKKGRLMLAMLACAPGMKRSRDWLRRHLWHRSFTGHGFSSLRQCLHNLRHALGPQGVCLCADRDFIWLEAVVIDFADSRSDPGLFLEDAPRLDGPSLEWLERMRARLRAGRLDKAG